MKRGRGMVLNITCKTYYELLNYVNKNIYLDLLKKVHKQNVNDLRKRKKIRIAFQAAILSTWIGDDIVWKFIQDNRFDVKVIITWQMNLDRKLELGLLEEHFKKSGLPYCIADGNVKPSDFDIIFYTSPYLFNLYEWKDTDVPLSTLACYLPYGIFVAKIESMLYNQFLHNITWKKYALTMADYMMSEKYCNIGTYGMKYSGYPKLDKLFQNNIPNTFRWKKKSDKNPLKIIYAPHHSINEEPFHSTFIENGKWFLDYAKQHQDTTSWVFKPHPCLRLSAVKNGMFNTVEEFDSYCDEWDSLPNAQVLSKDYMECFQTSDCMIFDSMSFMAEYMYVDKPALFLKREGSKLNEFGDVLLDAMLSANGDDYIKIEEFIKRNVFADPKKGKRNKIFNDILNYYNDNKCTATDYIYTDIVNTIFG